MGIFIFLLIGSSVVFANEAENSKGGFRIDAN